MSFVVAAPGAALGPLRPLLREHERRARGARGRTRADRSALRGGGRRRGAAARRRPAARSAYRPAGAVPRRPVGTGGACGLVARPRLRSRGLRQGGGAGSAPAGTARPARSARSVGAALPPARRATRGEPQSRGRTTLPRAPLDVRADHAMPTSSRGCGSGSASASTSGTAGRRAGPATTVSEPATSWRRAASRSARSSRSPA